MKNKIIILLAFSAILTLSFTFATVKKSEVKESQATDIKSEPAGGFVSEDKF